MPFPALVVVSNNLMLFGQPPHFVQAGEPFLAPELLNEGKKLPALFNAIGVGANDSETFGNGQLNLAPIGDKGPVLLSIGQVKNLGHRG